MMIKKPDFKLIEGAASRVDAVVANRRSAADHADRVILDAASSLTPTPVNWLWRHWLARGKFHVLAGPPGHGKTTIALAFAATVSYGGRWPDGTGCEPGNVLIWSGEDDPADTLLPRLLLMGADPSRIFFIGGTRVDGWRQPFDPARDIELLRARAEELGDVQLLIVDPVVSAVSGDSHKNGEVRRGLQPLVDLAASIGAAVLGISHFSKGSHGRDPVERVTGSLAFGALARVVMCTVKDKGGDGSSDRRILARAKSNIGPDEGGCEYRIEQQTLREHPTISASVLTWGRAVPGTARTLLGEAEREAATASDDGATPDSIEAFLRVLLADGRPMPSKEIKVAIHEAGGWPWRTVHRIAKKMGIRVEKAKGRLDGSWFWSLPQGPNLAEGAEGDNR